MKTAFLYSGQGSQRVGMGKDFYEEFPETRAVFDSSYTDFNLKEMCFSGDEATLSRTRYTQPCMVAYAIAVTDLLKANGIVPDYAAGLSLGEYSALYAAGVFDKKTAMELIDYRARIMDDASQGKDTAMAAVIGLSPEKAEQQRSDGHRRRKKSRGKSFRACERNGRKARSPAECQRRVPHKTDERRLGSPQGKNENADFFTDETARSV